jgi:hypothetical protein
MSEKKMLELRGAADIGLSVYMLGRDTVRVESQQTNKGINIYIEGKEVKVHEFPLRKMGDPHDKSINDKDMELDQSISPVRREELNKLLPAYAREATAKFINKQYNSYQERQKANAEYEGKHTKK